MKLIPPTVKKELEILKLQDSAPYVFLTDKITFCVILYSPKYKELSKYDIFNIKERFPQLIDHNHLSAEQVDFLFEQHTFALESL